ncbi:hypothetical protein V8C34DRAFT_287455 [Trichoderma compactum]
MHLLLLLRRCSHPHPHPHFHLSPSSPINLLHVFHLGQKHTDKKSPFCPTRLYPTTIPSNLSTATDAKPPLTSLSTMVNALNVPFLSPSPKGHARRGITRSVARTGPHTRHGAAISCLSTHDTIKPKPGS